MEKLGRPMGSTKARRSSAAVRGCRVSSKGAILVLMLVLRREGSLGPLERKSERGDLDIGLGLGTFLRSEGNQAT